MNKQGINFDDLLSMDYAGLQKDAPYFDQPEPLSAASILSLFDTNKEQRLSFAAQVIEDMQEGRRNPLDVHLQIKGMESIIEMLTDKKKSPTIAPTYCNMVLEEAEKNGKNFEYHNSKIQIKEVGTVYDWSVCNDPELNAMMFNASEWEKEAKKRQAFLKALPVSGIDIVTDEGETYKIYPPAKSSTTSVSVSLR